MLPELIALLEPVVHDDGHDLGAGHLRDDPEGWAGRVTEWGLELDPVRASLRHAQDDAEELRSTIVALGLHEQSTAQVSANGVMARTRWLRRRQVVGWRGSLNLELDDPAAFAARLGPR